MCLSRSVSHAARVISPAGGELLHRLQHLDAGAEPLEGGAAQREGHGRRLARHRLPGESDLVGSLVAGLSR